MGRYDGYAEDWFTRNIDSYYIDTVNMVTVAGEPQYGVFHIDPAASDPWIQNDNIFLSALDYDTLEVTMAVASKVPNKLRRYILGQILRPSGM